MRHSHKTDEMTKRGIKGWGVIFFEGGGVRDSSFLSINLPTQIMPLVCNER